jgi:hypothetical protein
MTTIEKPALPRRKPKPPIEGADDTAPRTFVVHFSFNNTVDPDWSLSPETEPTSRRERRVARVAAESERRKLAHRVGVL